ncbi:MAG: helix-turn-helix domain-containing protein [Actinobacteria bacterium]|nr:helix-turn-helix domain-containing protein [Acidimicrobiia bacterium]NDE52023.1 helix-turn-helix domain-containing protein [Actinomycetota bacterium]NDH91793.1 helix-turn-helix domain-containing protein [Actinomycetota bacterium]
MPKAVQTSLSLHEVARRLKVHYMTAYRYVRSGRLPAQQHDGEWRVAVADLEAFSTKRARTATTQKPAKRGSRQAADWAGRFETCLIAGDEAGAERLLDDALASGHDLFSLYLEVVSPALVSIGDRWQRGRLEIHEEHRASTIVARLFARVSARFAHRGPSRGTVVIGGPSGERHGLAITMVADLLRSRGWHVSDIGPDVPASAFAQAVKRVDQLRAVCVGVTLRESLAAARESITAVKKVVDDDVVVYAGGAAIDSAATAASIGADEWARDPRALLALLASEPVE